MKDFMNEVGWLDYPCADHVSPRAGVSLMFRRGLVRHVDEITTFKRPNPEREAAAQAKRDRKSAARLKQISAICSQEKP